ncbi:hypothetical protein [Candidatus Cyanaurora vandensis]|uniref:hypothetical protein n=1 Tax=Candidatus Cyanaurora vandensis TaxID=2714958 RepID=UPI00257FFCD3|nr:hypothetical protein [Candidatus Cyanaurora vandensis]
MRSLLLVLCLLALPVTADQLIILDQAGPQLRRVDPQSLRTLNTTNLKTEPLQLYQSGQIYTLDAQRRLTSFDPQTLQPQAMAELTLAPVEVVADNDYLYILHARSLKLTQLRQQDLKPVGEPRSLGEANSLLLAPSLAFTADKLWVTNPAKGLLLGFNHENLQPITALSLGPPAYVMPLATRAGLVYVALGETLFVVQDGKVQNQRSLREASFSQRPVVISQVLVNDRQIYAVETNTQQVLVFDRATLTPQSPLKFDRTMGQVNLDPKGRLLIPFPQQGEVVVVVGTSRITLKVGGSPAQVVWVAD